MHSASDVRDRTALRPLVKHRLEISPVSVVTGNSRSGSEASSSFFPRSSPVSNIKRRVDLSIAEAAMNGSRCDCMIRVPGE